MISSIWFDGTSVMWKHNKTAATYDVIKKELPGQIKSAVILENQSGIAVNTSDVLFIYNAEGDIRHEVCLPQQIKKAVCFDSVYYIDGHLTAIIPQTSGYDVAAELDEQSGNFQDFHQSM